MAILVSFRHLSLSGRANLFSLCSIKSLRRYSSVLFSLPTGVACLADVRHLVEVEVIAASG
jgi:hypothetical protein